MRTKRAVQTLQLIHKRQLEPHAALSYSQRILLFGLRAAKGKLRPFGYKKLKL